MSEHDPPGRAACMRMAWAPACWFMSGLFLVCINFHFLRSCWRFGGGLDGRAWLKWEWKWKWARLLRRRCDATSQFCSNSLFTLALRYVYLCICCVVVSYCFYVSITGMASLHVVGLVELPSHPPRFSSQMVGRCDVVRCYVMLGRETRRLVAKYAWRRIIRSWNLILYRCFWASWPKTVVLWWQLIVECRMRFVKTTQFGCKKVMTLSYVFKDIVLYNGWWHLHP